MLKLEGREFFRSDAQCVGVEPRSPQPAFPLHDHDFCEIVIVASGNGWHVLNGEPHLLSCGEVLYLAPSDRHAFEQVQDLYLTNVIYRPNGALLHPERLRPYLQPGGDAEERRYWQVSDEALQRLAPLLSALADESRRSDSASSVMAESLLGQLVVTLWRERYASDGHGLSESGRLAQVLKYLRQNCAQPIDLDELARRYGYSERNLRRVFREATATTPHDYLVKLRLCRAIHALRASDASITDVALASGFSDGNYFSYAFRKLTGMSPSRYRREVRAARTKSTRAALD
ncbi:MAG TPA: helix-turn-helix domain-containing protein [Polyangiaceae bacterium]|nr:helix-turn-helix domain-containing protein [Polyangiaceae bacterium]